MIPDFYHTRHRFSFSIFVALVFVWSVMVAPVEAVEQNVNPNINEDYYDAEFEQWVSVFERSGREVYDKRQDVVAALALQPGMHVADIGAGTGFYTHLFAQQVGSSGRVYAVDISRNFIEHILRAATEQGMNNVEGIVSTQQTTNLPADSMDLVFVCDTYHHFEYPQTMLASIHKALRRNGQLVIIDFRKQPGISSSWVMSHVRANEADIVREVEIAGFRLIEKPELLRDNFFLIFAKVGN